MKTKCKIMNELIFQKYPLVFKSPIYFECWPGWVALIENLASQLEPLIQQWIDGYDPKDDEYITINDYPGQCTEIKEKYGILRFDVTWATDEMDKIINEAIILSGVTCEICGKNGTLLKDPYNHRTRCELHRGRST